MVFASNFLSFVLYLFYIYSKCLMRIWYEIIFQKFLYLKLPIFYRETDFGKSDDLGRPIAHDKEWHPILMGNKLYF